MVRLLQDKLAQAVEALTEFQSHNGAIAAMFKNGAVPAVLMVSIPQWCDCCSSTIVDIAEIA